MASSTVHDTLISGYLAVRGYSTINKQSKVITVIKKWQRLWVVLGHAKTSQWLLVIYQDKRNWLHSQTPLAVNQIMQLHSFTDKETDDGLHMFILKFTGSHKISFACSTKKQKSEWLTAVGEALNACYNKKQPKANRKDDDDDWWQSSEYQESAPEYKEFQVSVTNCSLAEGKINRCRVCLFHSQSYMAVYGYSTYSSYTTQWTWKYSQLYSITLNEQTLTLQLYISDSVEEMCWVGNEALELYNVLCNVPGVWDCTKQAPEAVTPDSSSTLVKLEESDYTSLGVFLPDDLIQKMEGWYLVELVYCQHQPQLLGQYEVQLSLTHLHVKGCNCSHCWSWELHHVKSYSIDNDQLIVEIEGTPDVWSGVFQFANGATHDDNVATLYQLLQQLMIKLYLVVMLKQQLIVTRKQLSSIMNHNQELHNAIEYFSCELLEGPSQDFLGQYTLEIFLDQIHINGNTVKWVWPLTELYSYKLDQDDVGGAAYVTIETSNSTSATIEQWVWSGDHMIRFYSFLLELCQLFSRQCREEILISQIVKIRVTTLQSIMINTYTIKLTTKELVLIDTDGQEVVCSYPLDCIKSLSLDKGKDELIICTNESDTSKASKLVIAATDDDAQKLSLLINKAVQNKQHSSRNAQKVIHHQSIQDATPSSKHEILHQVSDEQVSVEGHETEQRIPIIEPSQQTVQHQLVGIHQAPADHQQVSVKAVRQHPSIEAHHTLVNTTETTHMTSWQISNEPQVVATEQEMIKTQDDTKQHQISTIETHNEVPCHNTTGFQQAQEDTHEPLTGAQQVSCEVREDTQLLHQVTTEAHEITQQLQVQLQQTETRSQQVIEKDVLPQATVEFQQVTKEESVSTESHQILLTSSSLVDTHVSVVTEENIKPTLHQSQVKLSPQETTPQPVMMQQVPEEAREHQLAVIAQQTPITFDQTTLQITEEEQQRTDDEAIQQSLSMPVTTKEVVHHYVNIQEMSTETQCKSTVVDIQQEINETTEIIQVPNETSSQKISVAEVTPTETGEIPQVKAQHSSHDPQQTVQLSGTESDDTCNVQQPLSTSMHHVVVGGGINQPIKIHRISTDVEQTFNQTQEVAQHIPLHVKEHTKLKHAPQDQQQVETLQESMELQQTMITTEGINPYKTDPESVQVVAHQISDNSRQALLATTELVEAQQLNEATDFTQAFTLTDTTQLLAETESTTYQSPKPVKGEKIVDSLPKQTSSITQYTITGPQKTTYPLSAEMFTSVSGQQQMTQYYPITTSDTAHFVVKHQQLPEEKAEPSQQSAQLQLISAHQMSGDDQQVSVKSVHQYPPIEAHHTLVNTTETTNVISWQVFNEPQVVATEQEMIKTQDDTKQHQISTTETHNEVPCHRVTGFQETQENTHEPLTGAQQVSCEVREDTQLLHQVTTEAHETIQQLQVQLQQTETRSQQVQESQHQPQDQQQVETIQENTEPQRTLITREEINPCKTDPESMQEVQVVTHQIADNVQKGLTSQLAPNEQLIEAQQLNEATEFTQAFTLADNTQSVAETEITTHQLLVESTKLIIDENIVESPPKQTSIETQQIITGSQQTLSDKTLGSVSDQQQMTHHYPIKTPDKAHVFKRQQLPDKEVEQVLHRQPQTQDMSVEGKEVMEQQVDEKTTKDGSQSYQHQVITTKQDRANQLMLEMEQTTLPTETQLVLYEYQQPPNKEIKHKQPQLQDKSFEGQQIMEQADEILTEATKDGGQSYQHQVITTKQDQANQLMLEMEQTTLPTETQLVLHKTIHKDTSEAHQKLPNIQDNKLPMEENYCSSLDTIKTSDIVEYQQPPNEEIEQLLHKQPQLHDKSFEEHKIMEQQPDESLIKASKDSDQYKVITTKQDRANQLMLEMEQTTLPTETQLVMHEHQLTVHEDTTSEAHQTSLNAQDKKLPTKENYCSSLDTRQTSDVKDQSSTPNSTLQISHNDSETLYQSCGDISHQCSFETQHDSPSKIQQTMADKLQCAEVEVLQTLVEFEKVYDQEFLLNELQTIIEDDEELMTNTVLPLTEDVVHDSPNEIHKPTENISEATVESHHTQTMPKDIHSQSLDVQQKTSTDDYQTLTRETQEVSLLHVSGEVKEVVDKGPREVTQVDHQPPLKTNKSFTKFRFTTSHKVPPFSVEVQELSVQGDSISCQPLVKTQPVLLNEAPFETETTNQTCLLSLEAQQSILHEISIDYKHKTVETRKNFYQIQSPDEPHKLKHLFSIEAKQVLSEQLESQEVSLKTQEPQLGLTKSRRLLPHTLDDKEPLVKSDKVITTTQTPMETQHKIHPDQTQTVQEAMDQPPETDNQVIPPLVEYDEDVIVIAFTSSDQETKGSFNVVTVVTSESDHIFHHYQLHTSENLPTSGEEISSCTFRCCSYYILVTIEKISQKTKFNEASLSMPHYQYDLQNTRKVIDELLLKYL